MILARLLATHRLTVVFTERARASFLLKTKVERRYRVRLASRYPQIASMKASLRDLSLGLVLKPDIFLSIGYHAPAGHAVIAVTSTAVHWHMQKKRTNIFLWAPATLYL
jgi:hypothetical protein